MYLRNTTSKFYKQYVQIMCQKTVTIYRLPYNELESPRIFSVRLTLKQVFQLTVDQLETPNTNYRKQFQN